MLLVIRPKQASKRIRCGHTHCGMRISKFIDGALDLRPFVRAAIVSFEPFLEVGLVQVEVERPGVTVAGLQVRDELLRVLEQEEAAVAPTDCTTSRL
jgi:hypothetical protein